MKKLTISNETELIALQAMLEEFPDLLENTGVQQSAISNHIREDLIRRIKKILGDE